MSVYQCDDCGQYKDSDYDPCHETPDDSCGNICEGCHEEREAYMEAEMNYHYASWLQRGVAHVS